MVTSSLTCIHGQVTKHTTVKWPILDEAVALVYISSQNLRFFIVISQFHKSFFDITGIHGSHHFVQNYYSSDTVAVHSFYMQTIFIHEFYNKKNSCNWRLFFNRGQLFMHTITLSLLQTTGEEYGCCATV